MRMKDYIDELEFAKRRVLIARERMQEELSRRATLDGQDKVSFTGKTKIEAVRKAAHDLMNACDDL